MGDTNWTPAQSKAIWARGTNLLVSAGAGSGKTKVMIERICTLIDEGAELKEMLVCTFTKTAAADMKRKLAEELEKRLQKNRSEHLRKQLRDLSGADIGTLHSWCSHTIKAWFFDVDVESEFTVLEEGEERALKNEAAEKAIETCRQSGDKAFAELYEVFLKNRKHERLKAAALSVYEYARARADYYEWLHNVKLRSDEEYRADLYKTLEKEEERAELLCDALRAHTFTPADLPAYADLLQSVQQKRVCLTNITSSKKVNAEAHECLKEAKSAWNAVMRKRAAIDDLPSPVSTLPYCKAMAMLVQATDEAYAQAKKARGKLDYGDLEHFTLRILCGDGQTQDEKGDPVLTEHGEEIVASYKYVFVDEYQDINPLQEKILQCFTKSEMFYVGDVKQSIYGFRMCSPRYFLQKAKAYAGGAGMTAELNTNFRSGSAVLDTVNDVFGRVMREGFGGVDYASAAFEAGKKGIEGNVRARIVRVPPKEDRPVQGVYSAANDTLPEQDDALQAETDVVAEEIVSMLSGTVPDEKGGERKVRFGDVAVLVRSRSAFTRLLEEKLRKLHIPVTSVSSDTSADDFPTVAMLLTFLRLCDNARDDVALSATMLSPVFGEFTADETACIRRENCGAHGERPLFCDAVRAYAACGKNEALRQKTAAFLAALDTTRAEADLYTVADLAGRITARYGCFAYALGVGGEREACALDAFLSHLAGSENDTLHGYLRYISSCGVPRLTVSGGGDAVRIMTVHASKGLEFPCVVLPQLHRQFNMQDTRSSVLCDEDEGIVLKSYDFDARTVSDNLRYAACARKMRRAVAEEELRILYVAMTRAQYKLCLVALDKQADENGESETREKESEESKAYIDWLYTFLLALESKNTPIESAEELPLRAETVCDDGVAQRLCERLRQESERETNVAKRAVKVSVTALAHEGDEDARLPPALFDDDRAALRGTAYHTFMQWAQWGGENEYERLARRFPQVAEWVDKSEAEDALRIVGAYVGEDRCVREQPFVQNNKKENRLEQGVIDLMIFRADGTAEIVDYKTGKEENLYKKAYAEQLKMYASAARDILQIEVSDAKLYSFSARKFISLAEICEKSAANAKNSKKTMEKV